ncbi:MAG: HD-GYP domain-containing protein [Pseudomonadota bacterium]
MSGRFVSIPARDLEFGMFVAELDRPWLETPFLVQGFIVSEPEQRKLLMELCNKVTIDTGKSQQGSAARKGRKISGREAILRETPGKRLGIYKDTRSFDQEIVSATEMYESYESTVKSFYEDFRRNKAINVKDVNNTVDNLVESIVRNPDACMLLRQMRRKSDYLHDHAMGMSIWSAALARQLGLPPVDIKLIAFGALVADAGTVHISNDLLNKPAKLTESEFKYVQRHVDKSLEILSHSNGIDTQILEVVQNHHERFDGSGYPNGLTGTQIPIFARIVAIADCYDAVTSKRPYAQPLTPSEGVTLLYELRDKDFQSEMVEEFIQAIGIYPVGTMVELTSGEIGTVIAEYRRRRLRPKILLLLDAEKRPIKSRQYVNLLKTTHNSDGSPLDIVRALEPGAYGLADDDIFA